MQPPANVHAPVTNCGRTDLARPQLRVPEFALRDGLDGRESTAGGAHVDHTAGERRASRNRTAHVKRPDPLAGTGVQLEQAVVLASHVEGSIGNHQRRGYRATAYRLLPRAG